MCKRLFLIWHVNARNCDAPPLENLCNALPSAESLESNCEYNALDEEIHIAIVANERYMFYLFVTALSVLASTKKENLTFHFFTENVTQDSFLRVKSELQRFRPCNVLQHTCNMSEIEALGVGGWGGVKGTKNVWIRTFFCELLPEVHWLVYLDCDILYLKPIETFLEQRDEKVSVVAVKDGNEWTRRTETDWVHKRIPRISLSEERYFNAGVLLLNLDYLRNCGFAEKVRRFTQEVGVPPSLDQTTLNALLCDGVKLVDESFNCSQQRAYHYIQEGGQVVIHYCSGTPWSRTPSIPLNQRLMLWHLFVDAAYWHKPGQSLGMTFCLPIRIWKLALRVILSHPLLRYICSPLLNPIFHYRGETRLRGLYDNWIRNDLHWQKPLQWLLPTSVRCNE